MRTPRLEPARGAAVALLVLSLSGAASGGDAPASRAECEAAGGVWARFGLLVTELCSLPTADAGMPCSDHGDCQSVCVVDDSVPAGTKTSGHCYARTVVLGSCLNYVKAGVAQGTLCVD